MIDLDELAKLEQKATPGPWLYDWRGIMHDIGDNRDHHVLDTVTADMAVNDANADLVVALRNNAPEMIATIRAQQARIKELEEAFSDIEYVADGVDSQGMPTPTQRIVDIVRRLVVKP